MYLERPVERHKGEINFALNEYTAADEMIMNS
jgi:hypothetical protein